MNSTTDKLMLPIGILYQIATTICFFITFFASLELIGVESIFLQTIFFGIFLLFFGHVAGIFVLITPLVVKMTSGMWILYITSMLPEIFILLGFLGISLFENVPKFKNPLSRKKTTPTRENYTPTPNFNNSSFNPSPTRAPASREFQQWENYKPQQSNNYSSQNPYRPERTTYETPSFKPKSHFGPIIVSILGFLLIGGFFFLIAVSMPTTKSYKKKSSIRFDSTSNRKPSSLEEKIIKISESRFRWSVEPYFLKFGPIGTPLQLPGEELSFVTKKEKDLTRFSNSIITWRCTVSNFIETRYRVLSGKPLYSETRKLRCIDPISLSIINRFARCYDTAPEDSIYFDSTPGVLEIIQARNSTSYMVRLFLTCTKK